MTAQGGGFRISVRLQNEVASKSVMARAVADASWLFERTGTQIAWRECAPGAAQLPPGDPCAESADPLGFTVRVMAAAPAVTTQDALGFSMPFAGTGRHAAVFYARIVAAANPEAVDAGALLGAALAHELAHLVYGSTVHGSGLMQANWGIREYRMAEQRRLLFPPRETARLSKCLLARGARSPSALPETADDSRATK
jgi:hypothetical protein